MEIYAKFSVDRRDGKTESTENVEAELQRELEANVDEFDVEDSLYGIDDVEIVPNPRKKGATTKVDLGPALSRLADTYFEARPIELNLGDPVSAAKAEQRKTNIEMMGPKEMALDSAIFHLLNQASEVINKARQDSYKAQARGR